ncbi:hypothetical protein GL50803_009851 [Giardia duodenalis]|uniref:Uncharacterized protein n=2 Tax=Giardia intestinalis TaxID=5741 RepID=A8BL64_GIAIC|nr:hypothetical protein GL50803_009851 [Giardia intestinalis]ESU35762.1 Hypothetical protein DHA2_153681 [Giardia intestinalis]KAE8301560.1 hypothetical protein GL50803_009851 [Giardia intestinalis]|eukprot:XP_001706430.1 Hypothetical protein GL50803_9851 [Giardia lamblia ATCC 50803]
MQSSPVSLADAIVRAAALRDRCIALDSRLYDVLCTNVHASELLSSALQDVQRQLQDAQEQWKNEMKLLVE